MSLKYVVKDLTEVQEAHRTLYVPVDPASGETGFRLNVQGVVPREKLEEFRNNNIALTERLKPFANIKPEEVTALLELKSKVDAKTLIDAGKIDEAVNTRVQALTAEHNTQMKALQTNLDTATGQLSVLLIDNAVRREAANMGAHPDAIDDIVMRAQRVYVVEGGKPIPKKDGQVIYGRDAVNPMPIKEWMESLKPTARHLFATSTGSGAGNGHRGAPQDPSKMTPTQKIASGLRGDGLLGNLPGA